MRICILENDDIDPVVAPHFHRYGAMFERLFTQAGARDWTFEVFHTPKGEFPTSYDAFDAVLLTGSKSDSFSQEPWVVELRRQVTMLLEQKKKLVGVCFGHQLIALCMGAKVGRAAQGWGVGRMEYQWHDPTITPKPGSNTLAMLVSHQDQVLELPAGAELLASSEHCPIAAYRVQEHALCVQGHPEFVESYSEFLLHKRRERLGEQLYTNGLASLKDGHDGVAVARMVVDFVHKQVGSGATP